MTAELGPRCGKPVAGRGPCRRRDEHPGACRDQVALDKDRAYNRNRIGAPAKVSDRLRAGIVNVRPLDPDDITAVRRLVDRHARDRAEAEDLADALGLNTAVQADRPAKSGRAAGYARTTAGKARP